MTDEQYASNDGYQTEPFKCPRCHRTVRHAVEGHVGRFAWDIRDRETCLTCYDETHQQAYREEYEQLCMNDRVTLYNYRQENSR